MLAFEATARLGGLSRAADELSLTQSAISHQIHNLEQWVGQPLFKRIGRGVKLTAAGELFNATVRSTLKTLLDGRERIEPYRNPNSAIVACSADIASGWLAPRLGQLRALYPGMEIWLVTQDEKPEIDRIDLDLLISAERVETGDATSVPLFDDEAVAVCSPEMALLWRALPLADLLRAAPLIVDERHPEWALSLRGSEPEAGTPQRSVMVYDSRLLLDSAMAGLGIAMVSRAAADAALRRGLVAALPQIPAIPLPGLWLTTSRLPARTPAVGQVYDWLRKAAARSYENN
ncbi:LysR family transcriptional regulator [Pseudoduganella ginsengisoli]